MLKITESKLFTELEALGSTLAQARVACTFSQSDAWVYEHNICLCVRDL